MKTIFYPAITAFLLAFSACTKHNPPPLPINMATKANVITGQVSNITPVSAVCSGEVNFEGSTAITEVGFCWDVSPNPTTLRPHISVGAGTGPFSTTIPSLQPNTTYYVRAYATNFNGTSYGEEVSFKTKAAWAKVSTISNFGTNNIVSVGGALIASQNGQTVVLRSTDDGVSWASSSNGINGTLYSSFLFSFGNDVYLTAYSQNGYVIYKSTNSGINWTSIPWPYTSSIDFLLKQGSDLFAVGSNGVYKTSNDGVNWALSSNGLPNFNNFYSGEGFNSGLFIAAQGGCYRSTDNGNNWLLVNNGMPGNPVIQGFCKKGDNLFAGTSSSGLYTSTDNGDSWTSTGPGLGNSVYQVIAAGNSMLAAGANGTYISQDTGSNWIQLNAGLPNNNTGLLIYHNSVAYLLRSDGLWKYPL